MEKAKLVKEQIPCSLKYGYPYGYSSPQVNTYFAQLTSKLNVQSN